MYVTPLFAIGNELYDYCINEKLLNEISAIHGGVIIPDEYKEQCLKILKWSPSALNWSLYRDEMIVNHRSGGKAIHESTEKEDTSYFLQKLIRLLINDYRDRKLKEYFFNTRKLLELLYDTFVVEQFIFNHEDPKDFLKEHKELFGHLRV